MIKILPIRESKTKSSRNRIIIAANKLPSGTDDSEVAFDMWLVALAPEPRLLADARSGRLDQEKFSRRYEDQIVREGMIQILKHTDNIADDVMIHYSPAEMPEGVVAVLRQILKKHKLYV